MSRCSSVSACSRRARVDLVGALLQIANWQQLLAHRSYADLFRSPSPVAHFWSLAIEEQFYWVWPHRDRRAHGTAPVRQGRNNVTRPLHRALCDLQSQRTAHRAFPRRRTRSTTPRGHGSPRSSPAPRAPRPRPASGVTFRRSARAALSDRDRAPRRRHAIGRGLGVLGWAAAVRLAHGRAHRGFAEAEPAAPRRWPLIRSSGWDGSASSCTCSIGPCSSSSPRSGRTSRDRRSRLSVWRSRSSCPPPSTGWSTNRCRTDACSARTGPLFASAATGVFALLLAITFLVPAPVDRGPRPTLLAATNLTPVATATPASGAAQVPGAVPATLTAPHPKTVAVFGDSVADWLLRDAASSYSRTDISVVNAAHEACDGVVDMPVGRDRRGKRLYAPADCQEWPNSYPASSRTPLIRSTSRC